MGLDLGSVEIVMVDAALVTLSGTSSVKLPECHSNVLLIFPRTRSVLIQPVRTSFSFCIYVCFGRFDVYGILDAIVVRYVWSDCLSFSKGSTPGSVVCLNSGIGGLSPIWYYANSEFLGCPSLGVSQISIISSPLNTLLTNHNWWEESGLFSPTFSNFLVH